MRSRVGRCWWGVRDEESNFTSKTVSSQVGQFNSFSFYFAMLSGSSSRFQCLWSSQRMGEAVVMWRPMALKASPSHLHFTFAFIQIHYAKCAHLRASTIVPLSLIGLCSCYLAHYYYRHYYAHYHWYPLICHNRYLFRYVVHAQDRTHSLSVT